ncbi:putative glucose-6-phosphate isomerase [Nucleospora cyclopteri]
MSPFSHKYESPNILMFSDQKLIKECKLKNGDFVYYDFTKTAVTDEDIFVIKNELMEEGIDEKMKMMVTGEYLNYTENRRVLHYLLRSDPEKNHIYKEYFIDQSCNINKKRALLVDEEIKELNDIIKLQFKVKASFNKVEIENDNKNETTDKLVVCDKSEEVYKVNDVIKEIKSKIKKELNKMKEFDRDFDDMTGITGKKLKTIVNIGIGGSDLGPKLINDALSFYSKRKIIFFSNVDSSNLFRNELNLDETLFVVVSKSWSTIETLENMKMVIEMFKVQYKNITISDLINKHFVAVTANENPTVEGVKMRSFEMWDFVGGRYSLWSAVGLSIVLGLGFENFEKLLSGAEQADNEFFSKKLNSSAGMMAIIEIYHRNLPKSFNNKCYVAYDSHLKLLYQYLQQAEMESNGKSGSGQKIVWGGVGTDVQHSFFQFLHQNEEQIYLEVLLPLKNLYADQNLEIKSVIDQHHKLLVSNCLAQTKALFYGKPNKDEPFRSFPGKKPSTTILYSKITPEILGFLIATYEHKIFVEGIYWKINSFDQFGVELGKKLAMDIYEEKEEADENTKRLWEKYKEIADHQ